MNKKLKIGIMIAIPAVLLAVFLIPATRSAIFEFVKVLSSADPEPVKEYIRSFGIWAIIISFALMVFQSLAAPLPAFLITFANAAVFGWVGGAVLSWTSSMVGAAACFGIAKLYGRKAVTKLTGKSALASVDGFFDKYGSRSIVIARLLPFMPFDIVSYAAGLTSIKFWPFFIATGIGQLPATIVYSYAGKMLGGGAKTFVYGLLIVFALFGLTSILRSIYKQRKAKAESARNAEISDSVVPVSEKQRNRGD